MYIVWIIAGILLTISGNDWNLWQGGMIYYYIAAFILVAADIVAEHYRRRLFPTTYVLIRFALVFASLFLVLQKMIGNVQYYKGSSRLFTGSALTLELMVTLAGAVLLFVVVMAVFKRMGTAFYMILGLVAAVGILVLATILPHMFPGPSAVKHVYNSIKSFLIIGPIVAGMPFVAGMFMSVPVTENSIRPGLLIFLGYTVVLNVIFIINHDLGSALVVGGACIVFLIFSAIRGRRAKMLVLLGFAVVLLLAMTSETFRSRIDATFSMFQNSYSLPSGENGDYSTVQYASKMFTNLYLMLLTHGIYGAGYGNQEVIQAMNTDYIVYSFSYQLGLVFLLAFLVIALLFVIVLWKYVSHCGRTRAQMHIMQVSSYLFMIPILWIILCNLGLVPLTGISFPLLVYGKSAFWGSTILLGVMCGIMEKEKTYWNI